MTKISMSKISEYPLYISMEQQLRDKAYEYAQRAQVYLSQNKLDKAIGCLDKAIKKIKRADMLKLSPLEEAVYGPLMNKLSEDVASKIMNSQK